MFGKRILLLASVLLLIFSTSLFAQADDKVFSVTDARADGVGGMYLQPETQYTFAFDIGNIAGGDEAIKKVAIVLPDPDYVLDQTTLVAPTALTHDGEEAGTWAVSFDDATDTITWEFTGPSATPEIGDIRESESLTFTFTATTDSDADPDYGGAMHYWFDYTLTGDADPATSVEDRWSFPVPTGGDDDNDDTDDDDADDDADDDDNADNDDDDDNDDGGCS